MKVHIPRKVINLLLEAVALGGSKETKKSWSSVNFSSPGNLTGCPLFLE